MTVLPVLVLFAAFVGTAVLLREAALRRAAAAGPEVPVRLATPGAEEDAHDDAHRLPGGSFLSRGHAWVRIEPGGAGPLAEDPYVEGWVCRREPTNLAPELPSLRIGLPAAAWYGQELRRLDQVKGGRQAVAWPDLES